MQKAYLGVSWSKRESLSAEIEQIEACLHELGMELFVFVDRYTFDKEQSTEMMQTAFREIDTCDFLLVELSKKAIGVGVEVGYAYAQGKPIVYLMREGSEFSTTVGGSSNAVISYSDPIDLHLQLKQLLTHLVQNSVWKQPQSEI